MNGSISYTSIEGEGTIFNILLPLKLLQTNDVAIECIRKFMKVNGDSSLSKYIFIIYLNSIVYNIYLTYIICIIIYHICNRGFT